MKKEFGTNKAGNIQTKGYVFTFGMKDVCGKIITVKDIGKYQTSRLNIEFDDDVPYTKYGYTYTADMI